MEAEGGRDALQTANQMILRELRSKPAHLPDATLPVDIISVVQLCIERLDALRQMQNDGQRTTKKDEFIVLDAVQNALDLLVKREEANSCDRIWLNLTSSLASYWPIATSAAFPMIKATLQKVLSVNPSPDIVALLGSYVTQQTLQRKTALAALEAMVIALGCEALADALGSSYCRQLLNPLFEVVATKAELALPAGRVLARMIIQLFTDSKDVTWTLKCIDACLASPKGVQNVARYVLRPLFTESRDRYHELSSQMSQSSRSDESLLALRLSFTAEAIECGACDTTSADVADLLDRSVRHRSLRILVLAGHLLVSTRSDAAEYSRTELEQLFQFVRHIVRRESDEARMELQGVIGKTIVRLRKSTARAHNAGSKVYVEQVKAFVERLVELATDGLMVSTPHRIQNNSLQLLDFLLQAGFESAFHDSLSATEGYSSYRRASRMRLPKAATAQPGSASWPFEIKIATTRFTFALLGLLNSTYIPVRSLASEILTAFTAPWSGFDGDEGKDRIENELLKPALHRIRSGREAEASTGAAIVAVVWRKYVHELKWTFNLARIGGWAATSASSAESADFIASLMDLIEQGIELYDQDIGTAAISFPMHGIILGLRNLLYTAFGTLWTNGEIDTCRSYLYRAKAICEGVWRVTAPVLSSSAIESGLDLADHEEARAEAMQNGSANGTPDAAAHGTDGIRSKVVLSSAWRAMKEVADLLETVLRLPCEAPGSVVRDVWTVSDFDSMGKCYTAWSTEIRHRGAYMALFPCYSRCCGALLSMDNWDEVRTLPIQWLNSHLDDILSKKISITRRSAGIPFAVCGIMGVLAGKDLDAFFTAVERLFKIANDDSADVLDESRVHALNTLRAILEDSKMTPYTSLYLQRGFLLSLKMFSSPNWICRNAALMSFSALVIKVLGPRQVNTERTHKNLRARRDTQDFFEQYPKLLNAILALLDERRGAITEADTSVDVQNSLFSIFLLLSLLQCRSNGETSPQIRQLAATVVSTASSPVWKIRSIGAEALTGVFTEHDAVKHVANLLESLDRKPANELHGSLLQISALSQCFEAAKRPIESSSALAAIVSGQHPPAIRRVALEISEMLENIPGALQDGALRLLDSVQIQRTSEVPQGVPAIVAAIHLASKNRLGDQQVRVALRTCFASRLVDVQYAVVDTWTDATFVGSTDETALIHACVPDRSQAPSVRVACVNMILQTAWCGTIDATSVLDTFTSEKSVPVKQHLLVLLGHSGAPIDTVLEHVDEFTHEDASIDARKAGARTLSILLSSTTSSGSTSLDSRAIKLIRRVLQDDSSAIRDIAHDMLPFIQHIDELEALSCFDCAFDEREALDELDRDLYELAHPNSLLFAVEPANIWLDPAQNVPRSSSARPAYPASFILSAIERLARITSPDEIIRGGPFGPAADSGLNKWSSRLLDSWNALDSDEKARQEPWRRAFHFVVHGEK